MSAYDLYGAVGMALVVLFAVLAAVPVAWSAVHVTRWIVERATQALARPARADEWCCGCEDGDCWWCAARGDVR